MDDDHEDKPYKLSFYVIVLVLAEILGTAVLMFIGCLGCISKAHSEHVPHLGAFMFGLAIGIAVQIFGTISGAHLNPAVTLAAVILDITHFILAPFYVLAQIVGAFLGYGLIILLIPSDYSSGLCVTKPNENVSAIQAIFLETIGTMILVLIVCSLWDPRNKSADSNSAKVSLLTAALFIVFGPLSGGSLNPVRSLAPAVIQNIWTHHWVYWGGPLLGGVLAAVIYRYCFLEGLATL